MKTLHFLSIAALSICIALLAFALNYEDPMTAQYKQVLQKCMQLENTNSQEIVFNRYPQLQEAKDYINKALQLKSEINSMIGSPSPVVNSEQAVKLVNMQEKMKFLRLEARILLEEIELKDALVAYSK